MYKFYNIDPFHHKLDGKDYITFFVKNPTECGDFKHLIRQDVEINSVLMNVDNVEAYCHTPPFRIGETIGLRVLV